LPGPPAAGAGAAAGGGQHAARPPTARGANARPAPPRATAAEAASELRGSAGAAAVGSGTCDLHPAGQWGWGGHGAEPDVPGGEETSGAVPAVGGGHRARAADGVPQRPGAEALAVQAAERLTDT